jgi:hypothetical protein
LRGKQCEQESRPKDRKPTEVKVCGIRHLKSCPVTIWA